MCFASLDKKDKIMIFERESIIKIKKIKYHEFYDWINWRIDKDKSYEVTHKFYCILISFNNVILKEKNIDLNSLKPIYPWNEEIIKKLKNDGSILEYDEISYKENLNLKLENEIKNLKETIKKLENEKENLILEINKIKK